MAIAVVHMSCVEACPHRVNANGFAAMKNTREVRKAALREKPACRAISARIECTLTNKRQHLPAYRLKRVNTRFSRFAVYLSPCGHGNASLPIVLSCRFNDKALFSFSKCGKSLFRAFLALVCAFSIQDAGM